MKLRFLLISLFICSFTVNATSITKCDSVISCANDIRHRIHSNLEFLEKDIGKIVKVQIMLDDTANIQTIEVLESSNDKDFDESVRTAVYKSFPYDELLNLSPSEYKKVRKIKLVVKRNL